VQQVASEGAQRGAEAVKRIRRKDTAPVYRAGYGRPEEMAAYEAHEQVRAESGATAACGAGESIRR
jgi:hypothetical protein